MGHTACYYRPLKLVNRYGNNSIFLIQAIIHKVLVCYIFLMLFSWICYDHQLDCLWTPLEGTPLWSYHCFLDSISHVSLAPHVILSCATLVCVMFWLVTWLHVSCSDWFPGMCFVLIGGFCHVVSWSSIKDALTHSKIADYCIAISLFLVSLSLCFLVYLCFDLWTVSLFFDWLLPALTTACLCITLLPLPWIMLFAGVWPCLFWPRLLIKPCIWIPNSVAMLSTLQYQNYKCDIDFIQF